MGSHAAPGTAFLTGRPTFDYDQAACRDAEAELFFPINQVDPRVGHAKAVCGRCPVAEACRDYALGVTGLHGIWGGTTEFERELAQLAEKRRTGTAYRCRCGASRPCQDADICEDTRMARAADE